MAQTGDWITPWFEPGRPFWGKPPLSFWTEAISFKLLGINEFAVRLPSWLATMGTMGLVFTYTRTCFNRQAALWAVMIYASCALVYIASGAVLTDPFLALGTAWSMTAFALAERKPTFFWRYGFFVGIAIGLLAKGPLALVLIGGPLFMWLALQPKMWRTLRVLPWGRGTVLMLTLSLPWYILAELKTPGFLNYFILGEHFLRFIDPGWKGDLYGTAHQRPYGAIWWYWLQAAFPWGLLAVAMLVSLLFNPSSRARAKQTLLTPELNYLVAWTLFTPLFFTLSGNILWTYLLPGLAAFSILMSLGLTAQKIRHPVFVLRARLLTLLVPVTVLVLTAIVTLQPGLLKTERALVQYAQQKNANPVPLIYVDSRPFSARFYSYGTAGLLPLDQLAANLDRSTPVFLAIPKPLQAQVEKILVYPIKKQFENQRYVLIEVEPHPQLASTKNPAH